MIVQEFMTRDLEPVTEDAALSAAAAVMWNRNCQMVPVVEDSGRVIGMVTDRDLAMASFTQGRPLHEIQVRSCMNASPQTCGPQTPLSAAWMLMRSFRTETVLVVGENGELIGQLELRSFLKDLERHEKPVARMLRQEVLSCLERIVQGPRKKAAPQTEAATEASPPAAAQGEGEIELEELA